MDRVFTVERTQEIFGRLRHMSGKYDLAEALAAELGSLSIFDMQDISASLEYEINKLPSPYKEKIHPYFTDQLFGSYFKLMRMHGDGTLKKLKGDIKDKKKYEDYCAMVIGREDGPEETQYGGYYHLVACFTMFVMDEPGHPVGMPFPGGFFVERRGEEFYCPIRDKEKDVLFSICNFCPALQSDKL